ncbi:MAG TPA: c-type cytochrome [Bryobacteraceae bacterium]|jgi:mono/diheme cytochrome c family protein|nr:c-type cytochrome [Bryobacteraceae bacterium]
MLRLAAILSSLPLLLAGASPKTVLDGIYTTAQATRGDAAYHMSCAGCHGEDLYGRAMGALRGDKFLDRWREDSLDILFTHIRTRMPDRAPGSLSEATYLDILAYILQVNEFPAGSAELTAGVVKDTKLVGKDGSRPLSTNALVQLVGCFNADGKQTGALTRATEPVRTHKPQDATPEELQASAAKPLGTQTFRLQNLDDLPSFSGASYNGHRVQVKGVLIRGAGNDRINVLSIETVSPDCSQ